MLDVVTSKKLSVCLELGALIRSTVLWLGFPCSLEQANSIAEQRFQDPYDLLPAFKRLLPVLPCTVRRNVKSFRLVTAAGTFSGFAFVI